MDKLIELKAIIRGILFEVLDRSHIPFLLEEGHFLILTQLFP